MAKGAGHIGTRRRSHKHMKKRCCVACCDKLARYAINNKPYCRIHWKQAS